MPETQTVAVADMADQLRAAVESVDTLAIIDDPPNHHSWPIAPSAYDEFSLYMTIRPMPGSTPNLAADLARLIGQIRQVLHQQAIKAGDTRAFVPEDHPEDRIDIYVALGMWTFLITARPDPVAPELWRLGVLLNVDPDSIDDEE